MSEPAGNDPLQGGDPAGQAGPHDIDLDRASEAIRAAGALLVTAGAGMGVDSGLPDFRGPEGFWRAYPPYRALGLRFEQMANPAAFAQDPHLGWGFYGHRLSLYRVTEPHAGYQVLRRWGEAKPGGYFVFTSNIDGHFQRVGFDPDRIVECHGSIHHLQCIRPCSRRIWPADAVNVPVGPDMRALGPLPRCSTCRGLARPNVLMFGDANWVEDRTKEQTARYQRWLAAVVGRGAGYLVIVECGAGTGVPTVRRESEWTSRRFGAKLVRINVREPHGPARTICLPLPARAALEAIASRLG